MARNRGDIRCGRQHSTRPCGALLAVSPEGRPARKVPMHDHPRSSLVAVPGGEPLVRFTCPVCRGEYWEHPDELKVRQEAAQGQGRDLWLTRQGSVTR